MNSPSNYLPPPPSLSLSPSSTSSSSATPSIKTSSTSLKSGNSTDTLDEVQQAWKSGTPSLANLQVSNESSCLNNGGLGVEDERFFQALCAALNDFPGGVTEDLVVKIGRAHV